ncbi:hypothetical protein AB3Z07_22600 [Metabacillus halosaccharovorans]|uniref:hypothetical protein n=1 Tax=Metabacillus halosaccharovorans TaxID=930124 RepID=UPI00203FCEE9|nr:hypothetical protein [Metabacillus halosaccharovorans]MCM3439836.1 hypothetical protein [Metabacillus halosaccharovorans]
MEKNKNLEAFIHLYELIIYYSENRDMPVNQDFDFFSEIEKYCKVLNINHKELEKEFGLKKYL